MPYFWNSIKSCALGTTPKLCLSRTKPVTQISPAKKPRPTPPTPRPSCRPSPTTKRLTGQQRKRYLRQCTMANFMANEAGFTCTIEGNSYFKPIQKADIKVIWCIFQGQLLETVTKLTPHYLPILWTTPLQLLCPLRHKMTRLKLIFHHEKIGWNSHRH